jgi:hypothetical protein
MAGPDKGYLGSVYVGSDKIAEITEWSLTPEAGQEDITAFGDLGRRRCYTVTDATGSVTGNADQTDTAGQNALMAQFFSGGTLAPIFLYLYTSGSQGYYGNTLITPTKTASAPGLQGFSFAFNEAEQWHTNIA